MKIKETRIKIYPPPKEYLHMIKPYLSEIIDDHKTQEVWKVHSGNKVIDYKTTLGEWKIQLTMTVCSYQVTYAFWSESTLYTPHTVKCTIQMSTHNTAQSFGQIG